VGTDYVSLFAMFFAGVPFKMLLASNLSNTTLVTMETALCNSLFEYPLTRF